MSLSTKARAEKLLSRPLKVFYHPSFEDQTLIKQIIAEMPDSEKYQAEEEKVRKLKSNKVSPELRPCYEAPLLNFEQEQHLFRKMNYYKHQAKSLMSGINADEISENKILQIEELFEKADEIRNQIAECNFRLATQLLKGKINFYRENDLIDSLLSDAYFDVLKAVDYFNWTLGNKFSTYTTWALKTNFYRDCKQKLTEAEKTSFLDDQLSDSLYCRGNEFEDQKKFEDNKLFVEKLLGMMIQDTKNNHRERQVLVLKHYFGLIDGQNYTLHEIAAKIGISKERVRQLKEKGLAWIQKEVRTKNINSDDFDF